MEKLVKYNLKEVPRSTTRGQWKLMSRWLREVEDHMTPLIQKAVTGLLCFGVWPPELAGELTLLRLRDSYVGPLAQMRKVQEAMCEYFRPENDDILARAKDRQLQGIGEKITQPPNKNVIEWIS